ncbi:hypothetical protein GCM10020295_05640 [Streptomyces cinereospinus]
MPQCQPVVEPERHTDAPTSASTEPPTCAISPPSALTPAVAVQSPLTATHAMSLPGNVEAWKVPWSARLWPVVRSPWSPQWPAVAKPCRSPLVTEKPTEQRAAPLT